MLKSLKRAFGRISVADELDMIEHYLTRHEKIADLWVHIVGLVFAGVGIVLVSALVLAGVLLAAAISPLLLPLLIPIGLYWYFSRRSSKQRLRATMEHAV